jgi:hypothetical protein
MKFLAWFEYGYIEYHLLIVIRWIYINLCDHDNRYKIKRGIVIIP